ncbi:hypothetical protein Gogos_004762 [Gossypium gossypioides]|uniref:CobW/HypB/UreG nucleotide-binding domain-containing protein n=1 Tax=Gossypium gossypioides TaxID=34282 RepID=A0A7J9CHH7_GOSGO|nr:hypothetical protein [Gossypium gossypioides]
MATLSMDIATTFINFTTRCRRRSGIKTTVLPLFFKSSTINTRSLSSKPLPSSSLTVLSTSNFSKVNRCRRFSVAATATTTPQSEDSDVSTKIPPDTRIPATIITGFLGSGKTTLLNHILTADHGKRIAVIENEYGEVDIDGSLVAAKAAGAEDIVMLNNGCLCCTVRGDLVRMIAELVSKKKGKFDHIVIETTGLANPAPIIQTFYAEDQVFNDVKLDGVVTLVDAKHAGFHLDEVKPKGVVNEAVEQIAYADRIIVNKTDLVGEPEITSLVKRIRSINGMAHLKRTEFGKVDLEYVLGIGGFDLERVKAVRQPNFLILRGIIVLLSADIFYKIAYVAFFCLTLQLLVLQFSWNDIDCPPPLAGHTHFSSSGTFAIVFLGGLRMGIEDDRTESISVE